MTSVIINDIAPRTQIIATTGQTVFSTNWTADVASDVIVYQRATGVDADDVTQQLATSAYNVAFIGASRIVEVTLLTPATLGDIVTIIRDTPANRLNLYTNTNFTPSMLNNDFGILTLVDQQAQLVDQQIGPRYNYSEEIDVPKDIILPLLAGNQIWAKNAGNTGFVAVDLNDIIGGGTVEEVDTGLGLTGGPITNTGTISFAAMPANTFWGNITGATALPTQVTTSYFVKATDIGVTVQPYSAALTSIAGLSTGANNLIYTTASNTYATIAALANATLITSGGGVPSLSQTLPTQVQANITQLGAQSQALDMNSHFIHNVTDPVSLQDAATKNYVDSGSGAFLKLDGTSTMLGSINMGNNKIINLTDPTAAQDAATKNYTDITFLPLAGGTMSGVINMNSHKITNLTNPSVAADAANKAYVDSTVGNYLPLSGGTMTGVIDMGNHKIINVTDPTLNQDAVNLQYLNTQLALYLPLAGGTMTGAINMNSHKITSVTDPTNPQDAATKNYVDTVAAGLTIQPAVRLATTVALTATYANGASGIGATLTNSGVMAALVIDGVATATNDRILVKDQASALENGIYTVTNIGSGAVNWVLTRATDYDQPAEIQPGDLVIVNVGTTNGGSSWIETASVAAVGTDPINFSQFTFSATAVLLKANNLSDVANVTTAFNNISPTTTKGDLIVDNGTDDVRLAVGANSTLLQANSATATGLQYTTATYPTTTTVNQILYSSATNTITGIATTAGGVMITDASSVPQFLANPSASGKILQSVNGAAAAWSTPTYPSTSGTSGKFLISDGTNNVYSTSTIPTSAGATANKVLLSDGTNYVLSTPTFPNASATARKIIVSDGTNWVASTETYAVPGTSGNILTSDGTNWTSAANTGGGAATLLTTKGDLFGFSTVNARVPVASGNGKVLQVDSTAATGLSYSTPTYPSASGTSGKILVSDGTNIIYSTPTYPNASATSGKIIISDGTNFISSTSLWPNTVGSSGKVVISDGTSNVYSTPTFPNASATTRKIIVSDGTNWVASTETYAVPGTSGNVLTSDGTNWVSSAAAAAGNVTITDDTTTNATMYPTWVTATSGSLPVKVSSSKMFFNPSTGRLSVASLAFSPTTGGILGTTTNDDTAAGNVGEFVSSVVLSGSAVSLSTGTAKTVTSISLTAGDWDVQGEVFFNSSASTTQFTTCEGGISTTNNTLPTVPSTNGSFHSNKSPVYQPGPTTTVWVIGTNSISSCSLSPCRQSLSGTTTVYLIARAVFTTSTASAYGKITARRIR